MLAEERLNREPGPWRRWLLVAGALGLATAIAVMAMSFLTEGSSKKRHMVYQIAILKPPPPPPPPKPEERPAQIKKEEVKLPEPNKAPEPKQADAPPAGEQLGVDTQGTGAGDSFGLVGKPGGKDITTIGGGGGGNRFAWYAGLVQGEIQQTLARNAKLRGAEFKAIVKVWMGDDGKVRRSELAGSTGNAETDELIRVALAEIPQLREAPPSDMPQPIRLRVTSRF